MLLLVQILFVLSLIVSGIIVLLNTKEEKKPTFFEKKFGPEGVNESEQKEVSRIFFSDMIKHRAGKIPIYSSGGLDKATLLN